MTNSNPAPEDGRGNRTVLGVRGVGKSYGSIVALEDIDFEVVEGEILALLGPSGSGKTTLLRLIAGLESVSVGQITLGDVDVTNARARDRRVAIMFQSYALFPHMSVMQNIKFGMKAGRVSEAEQNERYQSMMDLVQLDAARFGNRLPSELSGGQQQRVALARALAIRPRILLLDEPFAALDAKVRDRMRLELLGRLKSAGITTVLVTHDQMDAAYMSDRVVVLDGGRISQVAPYAELYRSPESQFVGDFIGESNLVRGATVESLDAAAKTAVIDVPKVGRWTIRIGGNEKIAVGGDRPHSLLIRREGILELRAAGTTSTIDAPDANEFHGEVTDVVDMGLTRVVWLRLAEGGDLMPFTVRPSVFSSIKGQDIAGMKVTGLIDPQMCVLFPGERSAS